MVRRSSILFGHGHASDSMKHQQDADYRRKPMIVGLISVVVMFLESTPVCEQWDEWSSHPSAVLTMDGCIMFHENRSGSVSVNKSRISSGVIDIIYPILRFKHNSLNDYNGGGTGSPDLVPPLLGEDV